MKEVILSEKPLIRAYNGDCMEFMAGLSENEYDLAIVDPPYGLGKRTTDGGTKRNTQTKFMDDIRRSNWDDEKPGVAFFQYLLEISENQIIWGGNYFDLPPTRCFVAWDKMTYPPTMSQVEMAWTSFDSPARLLQINSNQPDRQHPTQKPVALYRWLLQNYATCKTCHGEHVSYEDVAGDGGSREMQICPTCDGQKARIIDTHGGSMSIAIACYMEGFDLDIIELDEDYFNDAVKRFKLNTIQETMF